MDHRDDNVAESVAWRADLGTASTTGSSIQSSSACVTDRDATSIDAARLAAGHPALDAMVGAAGDQPRGLDLNGTVNASLVNLTTFSNFIAATRTPRLVLCPHTGDGAWFPGHLPDIHAAAGQYHLLLCRRLRAAQLRRCAVAERPERED